MRRSIHLLLALACAITAAGCGDDLDPQPADATGDPAAEVTVAGTDQLVWRPPELTAPAGAVQVRVDCDANRGHEFAIEGVQDGEPIATCEPAGTGAGTVELDAGSYTFFCAVPGHRQEGMEGELLVE